MYNKEIKLINKNLGYWYFTDYEHPLATGNSGRVLFHRHIASIKLGRWIRPEEVVHHIDENKENNNPSNLEVLTRAEHSRIHAQSRCTRVVKVCKFCKLEFGVLPSRTDEYCSPKCYNADKIKDKSLTKETLDALIPTTSWTVIGKMFGYSDNGIKKRAISLGCDISKSKYGHKSKYS